jgi:SAM-dependent methyltransferase
MPEINSEDYHDYVIKDGRFIGEFEQMYHRCSDPWHQDSQWGYAQDVVLMAVAAGEYTRVLDIGCGKGKFTHHLYQAVRASTVGLDISPTAVKIAGSRYPEIDFQAMDIQQGLAFPENSFDLIVCSELLWYVLPYLKELFAEIGRVAVPGGTLLIKQRFYPPGDQRYGNEIMEKPEDLLALLPFTVVRTMDVDRFAEHYWVLVARVEK